MPEDYPDDSLPHAIIRLEDAVVRAEAALRTFSPAPSSQVAAAPLVDADLAERHARLRAGTEAALVRLDRLIAQEQD